MLHRIDYFYLHVYVLNMPEGELFYSPSSLGPRWPQWSRKKPLDTDSFSWMATRLVEARNSDEGSDVAGDGSGGAAQLDFGDPWAGAVVPPSDTHGGSFGAGAVLAALLDGAGDGGANTGTGGAGAPPSPKRPRVGVAGGDGGDGGSGGVQ